MQLSPTLIPTPDAARWAQLQKTEPLLKDFTPLGCWEPYQPLAVCQCAKGELLVIEGPPRILCTVVEGIDGYTRVGELNPANLKKGIKLLS
jgi:hypothetical protein